MSCELIGEDPGDHERCVNAGLVAGCYTKSSVDAVEAELIGEFDGHSRLGQTWAALSFDTHVDASLRVRGVSRAFGPFAGDCSGYASAGR